MENRKCLYYHNYHSYVCMCLLIDVCVERERDENFIYISKQQQIYKGRMRLKLALVSIIFLLIFYNAENFPSKHALCQQWWNIVFFAYFCSRETRFFKKCHLLGFRVIQMGLGGQEDLLSPKRSKTRSTIKFLGLAFLEVNDLTQNCLRGLEGVFSEEQWVPLHLPHPPGSFPGAASLQGRQGPWTEHNHAGWCADRNSSWPYYIDSGN